MGYVQIVYCCIIVWWKLLFTNSTHEPAAFAYWDESITHNITNKPLRIWNCCQGEAVPITGQLVLCLYMMHFMLEMYSISKNISLDYCGKIKCDLIHWLVHRWNQMWPVTTKGTFWPLLHVTALVEIGIRSSHFKSSGSGMFSYCLWLVNWGQSHKGTKTRVV